MIHNHITAQHTFQDDYRSDPELEVSDLSTSERMVVEQFIKSGIGDGTISQRRRFTKSLPIEPLQLNQNHEANVQGQLMIRDLMAKISIDRFRLE